MLQTHRYSSVLTVIPEILLCVMTLADRFVILKLLKHHRTATGGRAIMGLGGT